MQHAGRKKNQRNRNQDQQFGFLTCCKASLPVYPVNLTRGHDRPTTWAFSLLERQACMLCCPLKCARLKYGPQFAYYTLHKSLWLRVQYNTTPSSGFMTFRKGEFGKHVDQRGAIGYSQILLSAYTPSQVPVVRRPTVDPALYQLRPSLAAQPLSPFSGCAKTNQA